MAEIEDGPWNDFRQTAAPTPDGPWNDFRRGTAAPDPNAPGILESIGRGAVEGATFGFDNRLGMDRDRREQSRATNPWAHFAGEVLGGIVPMVGASLLPGGQAATAGRLAQMASRAVAPVRMALVPGQIGSVGQAALQGAKLGTTYGALSGAGHTDTSGAASNLEAAGQMLTGAGEGAVVGGVLGAPLGAVTHGIGQGLGNMIARANSDVRGPMSGGLSTAVGALERDRITPQQLIDLIRSELPDDTATAGGRRVWGSTRSPWTANQVEEVVRRSMAGETPTDIQAAMATVPHPSGSGTHGPGRQAIVTLLNELEERYLGPLNLVDRASQVRTGSGDAMQMSMRAAAATPGEHVSAAREALLERQMGAGQRLRDLFRRTIGSDDFEGVAAAHSDALKTAGNTAYALARNNERPFNFRAAGANGDVDIIARWEAQHGGRRGPVPEAIQSAIESITDANGALPTTLQGFIDARQNLLAAAMQRSPGVTMGQMISGRSDMITPASRRIMALRGELSNEVGRTNPLWAEANTIWREGMSGTEAMEAGANMSRRLNARSRASMAEWNAMQKAEASARKDLADARKELANVPAVRANPNGSQQAAPILAAKARLDAALAQQELFRVGLVRSLSDDIANSPETHNLVGKILLPGSRQMLEEILPDAAAPLIRGLRAEAAMHRTYAAQFGSQTTPLREAIDTQNWAPRFSAAWYNPLHWGPEQLIGLMHDASARTINARRNRALMDIYMNTNPTEQLGLLRRMQALHQARSGAGNVALAGTAAAVTAPKDERAANRRPPGLPPYRRP